MKREQGEQREIVDASAEQARSTQYADASPFVKILATPSRVKILDTLLRRHASQLSAKQIAKQAGVSEPAFSRNKDMLLDIGVLQKTQRGRTSYYSVNMDSDIVKHLGKAHTELLKHQRDIAWHANDTDRLLHERLAQWVNNLENFEDDRDLRDDDSLDDHDELGSNEMKKALL